MKGLDNRHVARTGDDGDIEAAREYELPHHQLGSGSDDDDVDDGDGNGDARGRSSDDSGDVRHTDLNPGRRLI